MLHWLLTVALTIFLIGVAVKVIIWCIVFAIALHEVLDKARIVKAARATIPILANIEDDDMVYSMAQIIRRREERKSREGVDSPSSSC